jgi:hypothetical protein
MTTEQRVLGFGFVALAGLAIACGSSDSSSGENATGGATSGGTAGSGGAGATNGGTGGAGATGGASGASTGGTGGNTGGASTGGAGGGGGAAGACPGTPNTVQCGTEVCDLDSQFCCGGTEDGKCFALGAFCGLGGGLRMYCDDRADCATDEVCCPSEVQNPGNDAPYQTTCVKPPPHPDDGPYGCGFTGGNLPWPALCSCDADCPTGTTCKPGSILVSGVSGSISRCG